MGKSCYLCGCAKFHQRDGVVRDNPELVVLECCKCGLVFLSSFDHIRDNFYEKSGMHAQPINVVAWLRQSDSDDERRLKQFRRFLENKSVLDFGCGAGGFLLRARDITSKACGIEVESRLAAHFSERGLDVRRELSDFEETFDVITLFHVLEHFQDPSQLLKQLAEKLKPGGQIVVEVPNSRDALLTLYQSEAFSRFTYWSCHLFLFNASTLKDLADKSGLKVDYVQHVQRYSLANHLHWLSKGLPGGHGKWNFIDSVELGSAYEKSLAAIGCTDTLACGFSRLVTN